jgi:predicted  nucleic acid-binding Zn-ribbon protein
MKNKDIRTYLFWAILVIFGRGSIKVDVKKYEAQINALNLVIDSAKTKNLELESKVKDFEKIVFEANTKITRLNNRIYIIKKETDEKINAINNLNNDELYQFFTERYRQYLDSIGSTNSKVSN